ncbi:TetR/AcrR family transcriptional regulator [Mycolicibacterium sp.]|uniref:TetR/AcrR family transcriptional regulator n=1 Tax=Mycolicibacterium sp. TaxID=2320850 RepID=UPI003D0B7900
MARAGGKPQQDEQTSSSTRRQLMENEVLQHATRLFAERGFSGTSLQDVAESMGLKRPALYYYFKSKDALLERLVTDATLGPARRLREIGAQTELDPPARLHAMATWIVRWIDENRGLFLLLVRSESDLSAASAKKFRQGRRSTLEAVRTVIEEGVQGGQFRSVDARIASLGVWGICNWVAFWYHPERSEHSIDTIANQLADMAVSGLLRADRRESDILSPRTAIDAIRANLDRLEQSLDL